MNTARITMAAVDKAFPGVQALRGAKLSVDPGEVHVLLGENGAGKSTLMKILCGQLAPDRGELFLDGVPYRPLSPLDAQRHGIAMIHQELSVIPALSVAENILLGDEPARAGVIDAHTQTTRARALLETVGADLDPRRPASTLSVAQMQMVEIAKALRHQASVSTSSAKTSLGTPGGSTPSTKTSLGAGVLVMDEPTAALTDAETSTLFEIIRGLTARKVSVIYISHRMPEIFAVGDRVTVMRDGATVLTTRVADTSASALIAAMVGRPIGDFIPKRPARPGAVVLRAAGLARGGALGPIDLEIRAGEIFGLAGLMGSGRTEVARAIFGADRPTAGRVEVEGRPTGGTVRGAIAAGVGFVTEDRKAQGLVQDLSATENITLATLGEFCRGGIIDRKRERAAAEGFRDRMRIRLPTVEQPTRTLSGGNQQKVIIARWLAARCRVLLLDEPTRGVDVGAKGEIYELIGELAENGVAMVLISSDLPEVLALSDRVGVMRDGRLAGILEGPAATREAVMALAVGAISLPCAKSGSSGWSRRTP